jgi:uncharacterized protein YggE
MDGPEGRDLHRTATVQGIGVTRVHPDGVIVGLTVRHRAEAAAETLGETARKAELLEALFRELGIEEQDWVTGAVALNEWAEWDESSRREVRRGYAASSRVDVRLSDAARLGTLLAEAAARVEASVDGPRWEIRPENPAHDEARRRAMADAHRRADTYAQEAGLTVGDVVAVFESGAEQAGRGMRPPSGVAIAAFSSLAAETPVHSEGLELVAAVQVTYALVGR